MVKSTFFTGQPVFAQLCKYLDRDEVLKISTESGGERYRKSFDAWTHLLSMLHAVVMRFDSLREIEASALTFVNRMPHLRMGCVPKRSTLGDANAKRRESIFGDVYFSLLAAHRRHLLPDSRYSSREHLAPARTGPVPAEQARRPWKPLREHRRGNPEGP